MSNARRLRGRGHQRNSSISAFFSDMFQTTPTTKKTTLAEIDPEFLSAQERLSRMLHTAKKRSRIPATGDLFELFLIAGLPKRKLAGEPKVLYHYPPEASIDSNFPGVLGFCFPDGLKTVPLYEVEQKAKEMASTGQRAGVDQRTMYTFLLNTEEGNLYCVCSHKMFLVTPQGVGPDYRSTGPSGFDACTHRCYCIVSKFPFFRLHLKVLDVIFSMEDEVAVEQTRIADYLAAVAHAKREMEEELEFEALHNQLETSKAIVLGGRQRSHSDVGRGSPKIDMPPTAQSPLKSSSSNSSVKHDRYDNLESRSPSPVTRHKRSVSGGGCIEGSRESIEFYDEGDHIDDDELYDEEGLGEEDYYYEDEEEEEEYLDGEGDEEDYYDDDEEAEYDGSYGDHDETVAVALDGFTLDENGLVVNEDELKSGCKRLTQSEDGTATAVGCGDGESSGDALAEVLKDDGAKGPSVVVVGPSPKTTRRPTKAQSTPNVNARSVASPSASKRFSAFKNLFTGAFSPSTSLAAVPAATSAHARPGSAVLVRPPKSMGATLTSGAGSGRGIVRSGSAGNISAIGGGLGGLGKKVDDSVGNGSAGDASDTPKKGKSGGFVRSARVTCPVEDTEVPQRIQSQLLRTLCTDSIFKLCDERTPTPSPTLPSVDDSSGKGSDGKSEKSEDGGENGEEDGESASGGGDPGLATDPLPSNLGADRALMCDGSSGVYNDELAGEFDDDDEVYGEGEGDDEMDGVGGVLSDGDDSDNGDDDDDYIEERMTATELQQSLGDVTSSLSLVSRYTVRAENILERFRSMKVPPLGQRTYFRARKHIAVHFTRPFFDEEEELFAEWGLPLTFTVLPRRTFFFVLAAILLERKVMFVSSNIHVLSALVLSFTPLIRPFLYQSVLIPVLPSSLSAFLSAPVPFLVGVTTPPVNEDDCPSDVIRILVDTNQVVCEEDVPELPSLSDLKRKLAPYLRELKKTLPQRSASNCPADKLPYDTTKEQLNYVQGVSTVFESYFSNLFSSFNAHTIRDMTDPDRPITVFLKDSFVLEAEQQRSGGSEFLSQFLDTQMFFHYSDEKLRKRDKKPSVKKKKTNVNKTVSAPAINIAGNSSAATGAMSGVGSPLRKSMTRLGRDRLG
eukprot:TRINITY_DN2070_c0_g2_i1.p1 TRINITY_DN2070_c0_g2~~TRINITY_DN2070_c0_g2_i1.p1  ORF type:complete len:1127 (+),score=295.60 TRINITY_DN2070_c0_g2_i1:341-3721(+)